MGTGEIITGKRLKFGIHNSFSKFFSAGFFLLACLLISTAASATHLRAGNITITRTSCSSREFIITITVYTKYAGIDPVLFSQNGVGKLDFGDGSPLLSPIIEDDIKTKDIDERIGMRVPGFGPDYRYVVYKTKHEFTSGTYVISYTEANRNGDILNMFNSLMTRFSIQTQIKIDLLGNCDNSPILLAPPIDKACSGVRWQHNPAAVDSDNDSLSYEFVVPKQSPTELVFQFVNPDDKKFYSGNYQTANQDKNGPPSITIDKDGTITWDSPGRLGEYNIAFHVIEWRRDASGIYKPIGYVRRDMQIIVQDCDNNFPPNLTLETPNVCVVAGDTVREDITAIDPDGNDVKIEAFSNVFTKPPTSVSNPRAYVDPNPPQFRPNGPGNPAVMHFFWATLCLDVVRQPYNIVFKATDTIPSPRQDDALIQFKVMKVLVIGPPPKWTSVTAQANHAAKLVWEDYACKNSATIMQVWRRVQSNPLDPPVCVTGMPRSFGYTKIAEVPITTKQFIDNNGGEGLAPGAQYCYRLVAAFPDPAGGLSYVSKEQCFTTLMDGPIITNVSIDFTDLTNGEDTVKWLPPKASDIDAGVFPPPYSYQLFRAEGFNGGTLAPVTPGKIDTTFFIDNGLNTLDKPYHYRVVAYSGDKVIDTSARASTVRLELHPGLTSIELNWAAEVPWSLLTNTRHTIYRGPEGSTRVSDMVPIDSVNVLQKRLTFIDSGKFNNEPLDKDKFYCYCVRTVGSYGNVNIPQRLVNFSQIQCAQVNDTIPPCKPIVNAVATNCKDIYENTCLINSFSNTLTWKKPPLECSRYAYRYKIYIASESGGEYNYVATVADTFYIDSNLSSFARCYKVSAISRAQIEGPLSDPFCFDNCPNYGLPNVFTPNNADGCNDFFFAYGYPDEPGSVDCPAASGKEGNEKCARFVNAVNFTVYNRWGKEVYTYQSGGEKTIYINWNGRDDQGKDLSAGIYYYVAEVNFDVVDPRSRDKTIKGWVHIVR